MRKLCCLLLALLSLLSLAGCGRKSELLGGLEDALSHLAEAEDMPGDRKSGEDEEEYEATEKYEEPEESASDYLDTLLYISEPWRDGQYIVYGTDYSGQGAYGVFYESGAYEPLTTYACYYPLADGNLLVSYEEYEERDKFPDNIILTDAKIIDSAGDILFQNESDELKMRMYTINSGEIFVLAAVAGFDGPEIYWGVLDNHGNWLHELDDSGEMVERLKGYDLLSFKSDGQWELSGSQYIDIASVICLSYSVSISIGEDCESMENDYMCFSFGTCDQVLAYTDPDGATTYDRYIYRSGSDAIEKVDKIPAGERVAENRWIEMTYGFGSNGLFHYDYALWDSDGKLVLEEDIDDYLTTVDGVIYWYDHSEAFTIFNEDDLVGVKYPDNIAEKIEYIIGCEDGYVFMNLVGADGMDYFAVGDLQGNIVKEPFSPEEYAGYNLLVKGKYLVYHRDGYRESGNMYIVDWETEEIVATAMLYDSDDIYALGENLIVVEFTDNGKMTNNEIYDYAGNRIF